MAKKQAKTKQTEHTANYYDIDANHNDYRDTPEFDAFVELIESALTDKPQSIREIRLAAGLQGFDWLADALDALINEGRAKRLRGYIDKFVLSDGEVRTLKKIEKYEYSHNFLVVR